jgi:hypothetical protein
MSPNRSKAQGIHTESKGLALIHEERIRQIRREGYSPGHDLAHHRDELAMAAATYAMPPNERIHIGRLGFHPVTWPQGWQFKPTKDRVRELAKAGALIAAEIEEAVAAWWREVNVVRGGVDIGKSAPFRDELRLLLLDVAERIRKVGT